MQDKYGIAQYVRSIPDFPEPGIILRDITSIIHIRLLVLKVWRLIGFSFLLTKQGSGSLCPVMKFISTITGSVRLIP